LRRRDHADWRLTLLEVSLDDVFDLQAVVDRVFDRLVEERGEEWVVERSEVLQDVFRKAVEEALADVTPLVESLKEDAPEMLEDRRRAGREYREMIEEHWAAAFDLYELVLRIALEAGTDFGETRAERLGDRRVFIVLTRIHARGCRIAEEILALLKNGYGQGALARWRTLHELACIAMFIARHGEGVAERYLLHDVVESWRATREYGRCSPALGYAPLAEGELEHASHEVGRLVARFGRAFKEQYGWAAEALGREPEAAGLGGFAAIEKVVELDHLRAHYRFASHPTHGNAKGILFTPDFSGEGVLAGPSPEGLADPGQCALISLTQLTSTLLTLEVGPSMPLLIGAMLQLVEEAGEAFLAAAGALRDRLVFAR
jgi:hypothetical protein